ncbi:MAG: ECF-type sigma factor [Pyrinomonadaceae bacterium]
MTTSTREVTQLLLDWSNGDQAALDRLIPYVHDELRRLARHYMSRERPDHTLQNHRIDQRSLSAPHPTAGAVAKPRALLRHRRPLDETDSRRSCPGSEVCQARRRAAAGLALGSCAGERASSETWLRSTPR